MRTLLLHLCIVLPIALGAQNGNGKPTPTKTEPLISEVSTLLADTFVLYTEALNFHWNVTGEQFFALHDFFGKQYDALSLAIDAVAEQVRIMGGYPPSTLQALLNKTTLKEPTGKMSDRQMLQKYLADNEAIASRLPSLIAKATEMGDDGAADLFTQRLRFHQKTAWMVRTTLENTH